MDKRLVLAALVLVGIGAVAGGLFGKLAKTSASTEITAAGVVSDYKEALEAIDKNYIGKVDYEKISESSIQSTLWTLDPHSGFFTRNEFRKLYEEQSSQFYGIGVSILQHKDGVYVQSVVPNTPADKAGLRYGDRIVEVDGKDATEWSSSEVSKNVRGEKNTTVKVKVERVSSPKPLDFDIVRGGVPLPSIRNYFMLPNGVGYVGLVGGFQETTSAELDEAIAALQKQGMTSMILDLRGNPGGLLPQAIEVVSRFIPGGQTVVSVKGRSRYATTEELRSVSGSTHDFPLVVMINSGSASASEIVAGAIQDYGRGIIVGSDSFGKGLVQRIFPLPYGTGLTLTMARYYTPFGRSLQRDYSNGSIYEYYSHSDGGDPDAKPKPAGEPITTANGRVLYGGRGIEPDVVVKAPENTTLRFRVNEAAFFFVRQLVAGKINGLETFKIDKQDYRQSFAADGLPVSDKLFDAFKQFAAAMKDSGLTAENIDAVSAYSRTRIREELATATHSNEAGIQVLLESDPQVVRATEVIPEAKKLAQQTIARR